MYNPTFKNQNAGKLEIALNPTEISNRETELWRITGDLNNTLNRDFQKQRAKGVLKLKDIPNKKLTLETLPEMANLTFPVYEWIKPKSLYNNMMYDELTKATQMELEAALQRSETFIRGTYIPPNPFQEIRARTYYQHLIQEMQQRRNNNANTFEANISKYCESLVITSSLGELELVLPGPKGLSIQGKSQLTILELTLPRRNETAREYIPRLLDHLKTKILTIRLRPDIINDYLVHVLVSKGFQPQE